MTLRDRCADFVLRSVLGRTANALPEDLEAFVTTEIARAADTRFEASVPLALFFHNTKDREEFIQAVMEAKPDMIRKRWPR